MSTSKPKQSDQKRIPSDDEKWRAVSLLYNRLNRGFTLYLWMTRIHPMLVEHPRFPEERFAAVTIKNACVESVLLSVRDLDDFFRPRTNRDRDSDLRATDFFGYQSPGPFLSSAERESINQHIAHLTYHPVWTRTTGITPDSQQNWNTAELVGKAARAVFRFMDHLDQEFSQSDPARAEDIQKVRIALEQALKNMEALAELENKYFVNADGNILPETSS